jgi:hypothetical protein
MIYKQETYVKIELIHPVVLVWLTEIINARILLQNLVIAEAPTGQISMRCWLDRCAASAACTRKPLPRRVEHPRLI